MKSKIRVIGCIVTIFTIASCSTTQYGFDDVYNHHYQASVAKTKKVNKSDRTTYYDDGSSNMKSKSYEEEDYESYGNNTYGNNQGGGYYADRINKFYRPSLSISYFNSFSYGSNGYGNSYYNQNYYYNNSPYSGYNPYFGNPYDWHIQHYHNPYAWNGGVYGYGFGYNPWAYNNYSPLYGYGGGYNGYCPTSYGYGNSPYYTPNYNNYEGGNGNSGHSIYYGPRSNYKKAETLAQPIIKTTYDQNGNIQNETKTYGNGIKVNTEFKPNPNNTPQPTLNGTSSPTIITTPKKTIYDNNKPSVIPRYNTKPDQLQEQPKLSPQPRPSYTQPKMNTTIKPSEGNLVQPKTNQYSGVKVKTTKKE